MGAVGGSEGAWPWYRVGGGGAEIGGEVTTHCVTSVFLQKSFRNLHKIVQGCTTKTRLKVASATSHVRILTSLILWCSKRFCKCIQVGKNNMLMSSTRYSGS